MKFSSLFVLTLNLDERFFKISFLVKGNIKRKPMMSVINPGIINGSRRKRIAHGSGRPVQEVNALLKQYKQMKSMMKTMNKNKGKFKFPFM